MLPTLPNLDGLVGLARREGVDVRPTLVRVLTDLYLQKPVHTPEEEHRFTELTLWLLTGVDVPTRAAVAKKLASYAQAPHPVVRRLARDVFQVAEPVLRLSPCLTAEDLLAIIRDFGPRYAAAIAARNRPDESPAGPRATARATEIDVQRRREFASVDLRAERERSQPISTRSAPTGLGSAAIKPDPIALGDYFLNAASAERRLLLANLDDGTVSRSEQAFAAKSQDIVARLEAAALAQQPGDFASELAQVGIPADRADKIVHDEIGEPVVVLAKALAAPPDVLVRILLFLNPIIGHSVERVFDLVKLYDQVTAQAALHVVSSWQSRRLGEQRKGYQPLHWDDERRSVRTPGTSNQKSVVGQKDLPLAVSDY